MNILLPWKETWKDQYERRIAGKREEPFTRIYVGCIWHSNADDRLWDSIAYNTSNVGIIHYFRRTESIDDAMKAVDEILVREGWRLLEENDKLLSLL